MNLETVFSAVNAIAMLGWAALVLFPNSQITARLVHRHALPLLLAASYVVILSFAIVAGTSGGFGSLAQVSLLFSQPLALLGGWIHYLAFDLFVGGWEARDAKENRIPHLIVVPCLALTFLFGPVGLLSYTLARATHSRFGGNKK